MLGNYLIHVGLQDKMELLWQMELFHFCYLRYLDTDVYDVQYAVAQYKDQPSARLQALMKVLPIVYCADYSRHFGGNDPRLAKHCGALYTAIPSLNGRHLIVMDSDTLPLPAFNNWFTIEDEVDFVAELNPAQQRRLPVFLEWYNEAHGTDYQVKPSRNLVPTTYLFHNSKAEEYYTKFLQTYSERNWLDANREASQCGWSVIAERYRNVPAHIGSSAILPTESDIWHYTNIHYYTTGGQFDKRVFADPNETCWRNNCYDPDNANGASAIAITPFDIEPLTIKCDKGYPISAFIWDTIAQYKQEGRYGEPR